MKRMGSWIVLAAVVFLAAGAEAQTQRYPLVQSATITSPSGMERVLLDFGVLAGLEGSLITDACVEATLAGAPRGEAVELYVMPVTTRWTAGAVTWGYPWRRPGGDLAESYFEYAGLVAGAGGERLAVNVTEAVRDGVTGEIALHGFVVTAPVRARDGLAEEELAALGSLADAVLVVNTASARAVGGDFEP